MYGEQYFVGRVDDCFGHVVCLHIKDTRNVCNAGIRGVEASELLRLIPGAWHDAQRKGAPVFVALPFPTYIAHVETIFLGLRIRGFVKNSKMGALYAFAEAFRLAEQARASVFPANARIPTAYRLLPKWRLRNMLAANHIDTRDLKTRNDLIRALVWHNVAEKAPHVSLTQVSCSSPLRPPPPPTTTTLPPLECPSRS